MLFFHQDEYDNIQFNFCLGTRDGCSVNTDYVKVPIFPDFVDSFPDFSPISSPHFAILCKLDDLTELRNHNFQRVCIRPLVLINISSVLV